MGGEVKPAPPPLSPTEIVERLKKIGANSKLRDPHTIYIVEDPGMLLPYPDRTVLENIFSQFSPEHLEALPMTMHRMVSRRVTFYKSREAALEDAESRVPMFEQMRAAK